MTAPRGWPPMIRTDSSNAFANNTFRVRIPKIIREVKDLNPDYPAPIQDALTRLYDGIIANDPLPPLALPAPDADEWRIPYAERQGERWQETIWFFAETYVYRLIIEAVRWWETGRDPFAPNKQMEYASPALWALLEVALAAEGAPDALLFDDVSRALWGNRIDLSFAPSANRGHTAAEDDLLVDDRLRVVEHLMRDNRAVHLVADNAGTELTMDLVLIDRLLAVTPVERVVLHLKMHPTFVSDATVPDVLNFLTALESGERGRLARQFGRRLMAALASGRLRLAPDLFWNSPHLLWQMPPRLSDLVTNSALIISKGDANYRRLVGDSVWSVDTPFAQVAEPIPAPVLALRTMKSDPVVGLTLEQAARLDSIDPLWRVDGQFGLAQFANR